MQIELYKATTRYGVVLFYLSLFERSRYVRIDDQLLRLGALKSDDLKPYELQALSQVHWVWFPSAEIHKAIKDSRNVRDVKVVEALKVVLKDMILESKAQLKDVIKPGFGVITRIDFENQPPLAQALAVGYLTEELGYRLDPLGRFLYPDPVVLIKQRAPLAGALGG